jgi:predicted enzyme related to lactoylglutathione lyase
MIDPPRANEAAHLRERMAANIEGLEAVTVHVRDIHKARKFYGEILGLPEVQFDGSVGRAVFGIPGTTVTLRMHVYDPAEGGREPGTVSGVVFYHHDPAAACAEIARRGGTVSDPPHQITPPGFTATLAVIADPDGNEFVLRSRPTPTK